jgi:hypothetical protein
MAFHLNSQRNVNPHRNHFSKRVPPVAVHTFFKKFEMPQVDINLNKNSKVEEGFTEVREVQFIGKFKNAEDKDQFYQFS